MVDAGRYQVVWSRVRVRTAPGNTGEHVEWLLKGAEVDAVEIRGSWLRLRGEGQRWLPIDSEAAGMAGGRVLVQRVVHTAEPTSPPPQRTHDDPATGVDAPEAEVEERAHSPQPCPLELSPLTGAERYRARWRAHVTRSGGAGRRLDAVQRVWAISDCHVDHRANMTWLQSLSSVATDDEGIPFSRGAVIVAGDLCTGLPMLEKSLRLFRSVFKEVFYCVGNHELWGGRPDSVEKFFSILDTCNEIGVRTTPALLGDGVMVVPLQSWYKSTFLPSSTVTRTIEHFDGGCRWPSGVGDPDSHSNSLWDGIADFFLSLNAEVVPVARRVAESASASVVSFSHFIPRPELYVGYQSLGRVMGCRELDDSIRELGSLVHVFGHSHLDVDRTVMGCRYVQNNLGYPRDRWGDPSLPVRVWPSHELPW
eukprot:TRINITY_DN14279_c0_g2_i1.p1 TRINITY_DN14279_c0_g2~~TRINITY_DN14279_c0_g2_i1.p1  ORF type:complete len:422 (+),score=67.19 TRINITY_DN14279_c0_g2_i1:61-1326(+)